MSERGTLHLWSMRLLFCTLCLVVMGYHLLPITPLSYVFMPPDLILCLALAWTVRRPEFAPLWLIAIIGLMADLLLLRVPGLWAAMTVIAASYVHRRRGQMHSTGFGVEWAQVGLAIALAFLLHRLAYAVLLLDPLPTAGVFTQFFMTILSYPLMVVLTICVCRVRKPDVSESTGYRA